MVGAAALLAMYAAQALYLAAALPMDAEESRTAFLPSNVVHVSAYRAAPTGTLVLVPQLPRKAPALSQEWICGAPDEASVQPPVSPMMRGIAHAVPWRSLPGNPKIWLRLPMIAIGVMLGVSVWIIGRRWYGATGGLAALAIFSFSPALVQAGARFAPQILAAWGIYGVVFTAIALAHACYGAPGTVSAGTRAGKLASFVLALGIGAAAWPSCWFVVALAQAIALSIYVVRARPSPTPGESVGQPTISRLLGILSIGVVLGIAVVLAIYNVRWRELGSAWHAFRVDWPFRRELLQPQHWPLVAMMAFALLAWLVSRRSRWFGNSAPLIAAIVFAFAGPVFALPFVALFVAGVFADLWQSRSAVWRLAMVLLLVANAAAGMWAVLHI
jgi:hypothetical protein